MYRDVRFEFLKDNPFHGDIGHAKRKQLIEYMDSHVSEFTEKKEGDISFTYINPTITQLFGVRVTDNNLYDNEYHMFYIRLKLLVFHKYYKHVNHKFYPDRKYVFLLVRFPLNKSFYFQSK